ncbi:MAG: glycosyltransferase [Spirochaetales bacterium]
MKSVMFITGSMVRGGAERVISIIANDYAARGWKVSIVMTLHSFIGYELDPSIEVIDISDDSKSATLRYPFLVRKVRKLVKSYNPDAVVSFMDNVCLIAGPARICLKNRFVTSERIDPSQVHRNFLIKGALNSIYASSDCCVFQTKRAFNYFPAKVRAKGVVIPNPIKVEAYATYKSKRIVTSGRLNKQKNHKMLINVFAELHPLFPDWKLDIYGEGPLRRELEAQISEKNLKEFVELKGNVPDLHKRISDASLFVLSSDYEGLSNALLEAMMMGLPCISTACAGSDEVINNMENGILVPVKDGKALFEAMKLLMSDGEFAVSLGKQARDSSNAYRVDTVIEKWRRAIEG